MQFIRCAIRILLFIRCAIRILLLWDVRRISIDGMWIRIFKIATSFPQLKDQELSPDKKGSLIGGVNGQVIDTFLTTGCIAVE